MTAQPFAVRPDPAVPFPVGPAPEFALDLAVFEGPLSVLLRLIESRQLDIMTVPLADVADAYLAFLANHAVDPGQLAEFVAVAAQLILIKSRGLLAMEEAAATADDEEGAEEDLRQRLIEYRAFRDASRVLAERDGRAPMWRREPRETDLPPLPNAPLPPAALVESLAALASHPEPAPPPPAAVVPREVTIAEQMAVLRAALGRRGRVVLQELLRATGSRTEMVVTLLATLELVRRRELRARQKALFGPILLEPVSGARP